MAMLSFGGKALENKPSDRHLGYHTAILLSRIFIGQAVWVDCPD
jgi:hypothetical protein